MRRAALLLLAALSPLACDTIEPLRAPRCPVGASDRAATADEVCANLQRVGGNVPDCRGSYNDWASRVPVDEFRRLTACYARAASVAEVDECARACGADGGAVAVGEPRDASADVTADVGDAPDAGDVNVTDASDASDAAADVAVDAAADAMNDVSDVADASDAAADAGDASDAADVSDAADASDDAAADVGGAVDVAVD